MPRKKIYYPAEHIIVNLYTAGKEWMYEDYTEYVGFYHTYIDGLTMSGATYTTASKDLIPYKTVSKSSANAIYSTLKSTIEYVSPMYSFPNVTMEDYKNGYISRFFIGRRNFSSYQDLLEINSDQYKLWKRPKTGIDEVLYKAIELTWKLTGPEKDLTESTGNLIYGVEDTNRRVVQLKNTELKGLADYLTDYLEFSIYSPVTSQDIKKMFVL
jgi:hypothetical protein